MRSLAGFIFPIYLSTSFLSYTLQPNSLSASCLVALLAFYLCGGGREIQYPSSEIGMRFWFDY
jgi:hypothetical protein